MISLSLASQEELCNDEEHHRDTTTLLYVVPLSPSVDIWSFVNIVVYPTSGIAGLAVSNKTLPHDCWLI
jgi:hypothetical protein